MARLPIIIAPDKRLKVRSRRLAKVDADIRRLMDDMLETMYAAPGIGLAAVQVGVPVRVIVVDVAKTEAARAPLQMANPELIEASDEHLAYDEGCLSLPEHYAEVSRPARVRVRYRDRDDALRTLDAEGLLATCIQHEMDHLEGVLFVDHISALKRSIILRKLSKSRRAKAPQAVS